MMDDVFYFRSSDGTRALDAARIMGLITNDPELMKIIKNELVCPDLMKITNWEESVIRRESGYFVLDYVLELLQMIKRTGKVEKVTIGLAFKRHMPDPILEISWMRGEYFNIINLAPLLDPDDYKVKDRIKPCGCDTDMECEDCNPSLKEDRP